MWGLIISLLSKVGPMLMGPVSQFVTGINLSAVFGAAVGSVRKYWKVYVIAALVALQLLTAYEWQHTAVDLKTEKAAHAADKQAIKDAQAEAQAKVQAVTLQLQHESKVKADEADQNYSALLDKYRANLLRFKTHQSVSGGSNSDQVGDTTQSGNGPGASPELPATLTISGKDAEICAVNTARLQAVHDWAIEQ